VRSGVCVPFRSGEPAEASAEQIQKSWLEPEKFAAITGLGEQAFEPHTARVQAGMLTEFFKRILN